ncbi:MAG TPA: tetratricopeptide repeat protein, partial [Candidatus Ozemobacteraceae bacterium]|nr:tetratricopeptide repeat protein [Candidatus Ozemobacteraceae bacterium]
TASRTARYQTLRFVIPALLVVALLFATRLAGAAELDFGLPLFNIEEIRLEKTKAPDFNLSLLKKYLSEHQKNTLAQLHAMYQWVMLMKLSDTPRTVELEKIVTAYLDTETFSEAEKPLGLRYLFLRGLLVAANKDADPKNIRDRELEELLLKAEEPFDRTPEYHLVKGIVFQLLRNRPNGYFGPMKPFEDLKRAAALAPADAHFYFVLGQAFRLLGSEEPSLFLAIASLEKASSLAPGNGKLQHSLLGVYMGLHESYQNQAKDEPFWLQEAVFKKILALSPNNPHALNNLGFLYAEFGVHRELAQSLVQRAVDQMPDNPGFRDSLGWAAFKNAQLDKATQELQKAVELSPDTYEPHYHLGTVYYVTKQHEKAIQMYERAVALRPTSSEALNNYAYLLTELDRDLGRAEKMAARAVKIEPNNASYLDTYGWVLFRQGNASEGLRLLLKAASQAPDVGEILLHLGKAYLQLDKFETALEYFRQALKADPGLENLQRELYQAIVLRAQYRALAEYHGLFGAKADSTHLNRILLQLVRIFQEEGMFDRAIETTRLCEQLKRGSIDLSKPLFDFYTIETASATEMAASATALPGGVASSEELISPLEGDDLESSEGIEPPPAGPEDETASETAQTGPLEPVFPTVASVPLALHIGPAAMSVVADRLFAFPDFGNLSITLFVKQLRKPSRNSVLLLEYPGLEQHDTLKALRFHLGMLGCPIDPNRIDIAGNPGLRARMGRQQIWALQAGRQLMVGSGDEPSPEELQRLGGTFPYKSDTLFAMYLDWRLWEAEIPLFLRPWIDNPLRPFSAIYTRHRLEGLDVTEESQLIPLTKVDQKFMKLLADQLFQFKRKMLELRLPVDVRVSANDGCVEMEATYRRFVPRVREWLESLKPFSWLIEPRFLALECAARRFFFGRALSDLAGLCPEGGKVAVDGPSGCLICTRHPIYG